MVRLRQLPAAIVIAMIAAACATRDPRAHFATELTFLQTGVDPEKEEREVRRVLAQRGLRVVARLVGPSYVALGASTRLGEHSAVRIITRRGVVLAEDASASDLFHPGRVALIEHFGGTWGEYVLLASARVASGRDLGCVTLHRVLPDGSVVASTLDVRAFGSLACVANVAPGSAGRIRATVAWPALHALKTPSVEVELALVEQRLDRAPPRVPHLRVATQGEWLERERTRLSTARLARAPFSERHAIGVARAALAGLTGADRERQIGIYRESVQAVPPGSAEAEIVVATIDHIGRGWSEPGDAPEEAASEEGDPSAAQPPEGAEPSTEEPSPSEEPDPDELGDPDAIVIEPEPL